MVDKLGGEVQRLRKEFAQTGKIGPLQGLYDLYIGGIERDCADFSDDENSAMESLSKDFIGGFANERKTYVDLALHLYGLRRAQGNGTSDTEQITQVLTGAFEFLDIFADQHTNASVSIDANDHLPEVFDRVLERFPDHGPSLMLQQEWNDMMGNLVMTLHSASYSHTHPTAPTYSIITSKPNDYAGYPVRGPDSFLEKVITAMKGREELNDIFFFCCHTESRANDIQHGTLKVQSDRVRAELSAAEAAHYSRIMDSLFTELQTWRQRKLDEYISNATGWSNADRIKFLQAVPGEYADRLTELSEIATKLPALISATDDNIREILFVDDREYVAHSWTDLSSSLAETTQNLRSLMQRKGGSSVAHGLISYEGVPSLSIAAKHLASSGALDGRCASFVKRYAEEGGHPRVIGAAARWYHSQGSPRDIEVAVDYFMRILPTTIEYSMIRERSEQGWFSDIALDSRSRFEAVLGAQHKETPIEEMARLVEGRNAFPLDHGMDEYEDLLRGLHDSGVFGDSESEMIIPHMPVHSYKNPGVTRNPTYTLRSRPSRDAVLSTFIKLYRARRDAEFESRLMQYLKEEGLDLPDPIRILHIGKPKGGHHVNATSFVDGRSLYEILNDRSEVVSYGDWHTIVEQLVEIEDTALSFMETASCPRGMELEELTPNSKCFRPQIVDRLVQGKIPRDLAESLYLHLTEVIRYMVDQPTKYFKDPNPRNVMRGTKWSHVDFECRGKNMPEVDFAKLVRNGLEYDAWEPIDYDADLKRKDPLAMERTRQYLRQKRYLEESAENTLFKDFCGMMNADPIPMRYDFARLYVHAYYIAWFSMNLVKNRSVITANRRSYNILEDKVLTDDILDRAHGYDITTEQRESLAGLRHDLDILGRLVA
ncbi:MAG: hypothetical protein ABH879_09210 [archaeon]